MNAPLEKAQKIVSLMIDPLDYANESLRILNGYDDRIKAKNKEIRYWKKVKGHIKDLVK